LRFGLYVIFTNFSVFRHLDRQNRGGDLLRTLIVIALLAPNFGGASVEPKENSATGFMAVVSGKRNQVHQLVNKERSRRKARAVALNPELNQVAQKYAEEMARRGFFAHSNPEGVDMKWRLKYAKINYGWAGENIAMGYEESSEVVTGWMKSPGHRKNILQPQFGKMGIGFYKKYWVQVFTD
jgi:uncharacterized protein YkwD